MILEELKKEECKRNRESHLYDYINKWKTEENSLRKTEATEKISETNKRTVESIKIWIFIIERMNTNIE
ncbi:hypothetical protein PMALA_076390 [Plasmodium malariae]|uniref:STP1 protein n=1 Tax=Plasmodium malariae TaxID=5858 RepID=A0A1A8X842_PLAMA|nr:hypothetical protein PMALA_076390 [Plasmodium malariae]